MKIKALLSVITGIVLLTGAPGCTGKKTSDIQKPDIPMQTVTQNSQLDYITFEFEIPKDWFTEYEAPFAIVASSEEISRFFDGIYISNYHIVAEGMVVSKETQKMYRDLLAGKTDAYRDYLRESANRDYHEMLREALGPFAFFLPSSENDETSQLPSEENDVADFRCRQYQGKNGNITEVQYSFDLDGETIHAIECYREDIPYVVSATLDDKLEISLGEIALWLVDSLQVTEHFKIKGDIAEKKG